MSSTFVLPAAFSHRGYYLILALICSPLFCQNPANSSPSPATATTAQSDQAAIEAMQNVIAQSGGAAAWKAMRSAKEIFSVLPSGAKQPHVMTLLDDWSLGTTRYRRRSEGKNSPPADHNGTDTFSVKTATGNFVAPEFDQARTLIGRLPAAAAEVILRRSEYALKVSKSQACKSNQVCIDVFRKSGSGPSLNPEQQWKISAATGLPITVRYEAEAFGKSVPKIWKEIYFLKYATEDGLVIPIWIGTNLAGKWENWTFISLAQNPGFDSAKFDQEAAQ